MNHLVRGPYAKWCERDKEGVTLLLLTLLDSMHLNTYTIDCYS